MEGCNFRDSDGVLWTAISTTDEDGVVTTTNLRVENDPDSPSDVTLEKWEAPEVTKIAMPVPDQGDIGIQGHAVL